MRDHFSLKYLTGSGIEIGALDKPIKVNDGVKVTYVDRVPLHQLKREYPNAHIVHENYTVDSERLHSFEDSSQDFIVANHVLEHVEDVLGTLKNWFYILKKEGILFITLPEKNHTFDCKRQVTPLSHFIAEQFHFINQYPHYLDWFMYNTVDNLSLDEAMKNAERAWKNAENIHFHVFSRESMRELFEYCQKVFTLKIIEQVDNGAEVIWVLQKTSNSVIC